MKNQLITLENEFLSISLAADCSGVIIDKKKEVRWQIQPVAFQDNGEIAEDVVWIRKERSFCDFYPGRFRAEKTGSNSLRIQLLRAPLNEPQGFFNCHILLDGPTLEFKVEDIDDSIPSLVFPPPIVSDSLVIPNDVGQWKRKNQPSWECQFVMQNCGINMRWIGGLKADERHGWIGILDENSACGGFYINNLSAPPCWLRSMGKWDKTRSIRYAFTDGGYVGLAKIFRRYAQEKGLFRSLRDKIADSPVVERLLGGRILSFFQCHTIHRHFYEELNLPLPAGIDETNGKVQVKVPHAHVAEVIRDAKAWGMKKGIFCLRGTFRGGYDDHHPDIWPPEPALGSLEELQAILAQPDPYLAVLHDNYQDIYPHAPSFPQGIIQTRKGEKLRGGPWHGGQCYIMNSAEALKNVKRNWLQLQTLQPQGHFIDTISCVQLYQDFHPEHPITRAGDCAARHEIMKFYKDHHIALGSENAADFGAPYLDYLENRHKAKPNENIPLWSLVYHDAAFCARYSSSGTSGGKPVRHLENILWGYMKYWPINTLEEWKTDESDFKASLYEDEWHARVGLDEMTNHRYLSEDGQVEQTVFSSGVSAIVNFADEPRQVEGKTIPAQSHLIVEE